MKEILLCLIALVLLLVIIVYDKNNKIKEFVAKYIIIYNEKCKKPVQICINLIIGGFWGFILSLFIPYISDLFGLHTILQKIISITAVLCAIFALFMYYSYEYGLKYKDEKELLKKMEEIKNEIIRNTNIYYIFITLIGDFLETISTKQFQVFDQQKEHNVDLAFELASFDENDVFEENNKLLIDKKAISRIRRMRVLEICKSLLNNNINLFYATEFHLIEVIDDVGKMNNDNAYREALKDNENIKYCKTKKRIIGISKKEYNNIRTNHNFDNFVSYLQWHIDNKWEAHLYIVQDELFPITLEKLGSNNHDCNELTDFIYVEYCHKRGKDKECVVFAQNDEGKCKYFKKPSFPIDDYKKLFESLLVFNKSNSFKQSKHVLVNKEFISKLCTIE